HFSVTTGGGHMSQPNVTTNAAGFAQSTLTLGTVAGTGNNTVTPTAVNSLGNPLVGTGFPFVANAKNDTPTQIFIVSGNNQSGIEGNTLPAGNPFVVLVTDQFGNPAIDQVYTLNFAVTANTGFFNTSIGA